MNNNNWEAADVHAIVGIAHEEKMFEYNGLMIVVTQDDSDDPMMDQINDLVEACGGAACMAFDLSAIMQLLHQSSRPTPMAEFVIAHAKGEEFPMAILFKQSLMKVQYIDQLPFIVAHEIGHMANGDTARNISIQSETKELQQEWEACQLSRECLADSFATKLLNDKTLGLYCLNYIQNHLLSDKGKEIREDDPDYVKSVLATCKTRIDNLTQI